MHTLLHRTVLFSALVSAAVFFGCYESTRFGALSTDVSETEPDTVRNTDTESIPESQRDTDSDTASFVQGPMTFLIRNKTDEIAYFDLNLRKWMDLKREDPESDNELFLDWPYCAERCADVPDDSDPLCHRPCIVYTQVYTLYPGDEVAVRWDGKVRLLDPIRLPYCRCSIETDPLPGRYTVTLLVYNEINCPEPCSLPGRSGLVWYATTGNSGPTRIAVFSFEIPRSEPELILEF